MREVVLIVSFIAVAAIASALLASPAAFGGVVLGVMFGAAVATKK